MGFMQDNTAAEVNGGRVEPMDQVNYTQENPRYMSGKTFLDKLDMQISDSSDNLEVDGKIAADVANLMTDAFNTTSATEYMDTMFKLGNMVLDYGMGILGSTDAITKGPAHAPRPASSTPAIGAIPALVRSCSITFMRLLF